MIPRYAILFFLTCAGAFLVYPSWYHEGLPTAHRIVLLNLLFAYYALLGFLMWRIFGNIKTDGGEAEAGPGRFAGALNRGVSGARELSGDGEMPRARACGCAGRRC